MPLVYRLPLYRNTETRHTLMWQRVCAQIRSALSTEEYQAWIAPLIFKRYTNDELVCVTFSAEIRWRVCSEYLLIIRRAFRAENIEPPRITILVAEPKWAREPRLEDRPLIPVRLGLAEPQPITVAHIRFYVMRFYGLTPRDMTSCSRAPRTLRPRQIAMYLSRELTERTLEEIGAHFAKDHTCVLAAKRTIPRLCANNRLLARQVEFIRACLIAAYIVPQKKA